MLHKIPFQPDFPHLKLMQLSPWTKMNTCFLCYYPCQEENIFPLLHFVPNTVWDFVKCPIQLWCTLFMVVKSPPMDSPRKFSTPISPEIRVHFPGGEVWGHGRVENRCARRNVTRSAALLNDEEADSKVENYWSTVSPEDNLTVWQGLLPVNPHGVLAISHLLRNPF